MSLAICVSVYNDQHLLKRLLSQIQDHCPNAVVLVISDGIKLEDWCKKDTLWFECSRAKAEGQKGLWTQRYLEMFLQHTSAETLLRVDPDTCIWKHFALPDGEYDLFGTISPTRYKYPYVRGGCIGFTRDSAEKIVESNLLLDDRYKNYNYQRYKHWRWEHEVESDEQFAFQDWIVGDICHKLNLTLKDWEDVCILGNQNIIPEIGNYSITHPHPVL